MTDILQSRLFERLEHTNGRLPLAILDVDLTLVDNAPRTRALLASFCREHCPELEAGVASLELAFSVQKNAVALGIPEHLHHLVFPHWRRTFFDPAYLEHDIALPGAVAAVLALVNAGVTVVYLTARPSRLAAATALSFASLGFPVGVAGTVLVTKSPEKLDDQAFKEQALDWIGRFGHPILVADNEPAHVNAMHAAFPGALAVHVATRHSEPAPVVASAAVIAASLAGAIIAV